MAEAFFGLLLLSSPLSNGFFPTMTWKKCEWKRPVPVNLFVYLEDKYPKCEDIRLRCGPLDHYSLPPRRHAFWRHEPLCPAYQLGATQGALTRGLDRGNGPEVGKAGMRMVVIGDEDV